MARYIDKFDASRPRAALVHMPTGSGKTAVIASLARCFDRRGPVVVVTPRVGLRDQLARDIDSRFFKHAEVSAASLPRRVVTLEDGRSHPGNLSELVLVATVQMLTSIRKLARRLSDELEHTAVLVLFDEGHYEPAVVWSQAIRSFRCPRIIFTATPFRDDFKLFDIAADHAYRYSFDHARRERYVRDVKLHPYSPVRSPAKFAGQVVDAYDHLFEEPNEGDGKRPRGIIRCDKPEEIRQLIAAVRHRGRSVIGIHETFDENPAAGEYYKVPDPDVVDATFWVHQFKLLEGIDDPRFRLLALYSELRGMRAFVQQVGRVIRNPRQVHRAIAHVLDHSRRRRQTQLWEEFLEYDRLIEQGDPAALDLNHRSLVRTLQEAVPGLLYANGRLRRPADFAQLDLEDLRLPLSANVFDKPRGFSLSEVQKSIARQCEKDDLLPHAPAPRSDTAVVFYVRIGSSPLLETGFFAEPKLGVSLLHVRGNYLFVFDSGSGRAVRTIEAVPVDQARLRKLYVRSTGARLTHVSTLNANLGADQVRARGIAAVSIDNLVPSFDEHAYVLRTATGYSRGRRGSEDGEEGEVRRYIGVGSGRVTDLGAGFVPFRDWTRWAADLANLFEARRSTLQVFRRWASSVPVPSDSKPLNILLDVSDIKDRYRTTGAGGVPGNKPMELSELCADVSNGEFRIFANGRPCRVEIEFDPGRHKYELRSQDLDENYHSTDRENSEGVVRYLNRTQSLRVLPAAHGYFYTLGQFYRPLIQFGREYDDAKMGILASLTSIPRLRSVKSEKGKTCRPDGSGWEQGCLFDLIDSLGAGSDLERPLSGTEVMVCDDLNDESADFLLVQRANRWHRRRVVLIHAKADPKGSVCSASALQDVCGQLQKNLAQVSLFADTPPSKRVKWGQPWNGRPHTAGSVNNRLRKSLGEDPEEDIRRTVKDPSADREVWIMVGNVLSKQAFERMLRQSQPPRYAIQTAYLLLSTINSVAAAGARLTVFCG
jgi:superfamily II DNA or RNA helicase